MELVVQIACGIVLGFILLCFLPYIIGAVAIVIGVALVAAVGVIGWSAATPLHGDIKELLGFLFVFVFLAGWAAVLFFLARDTYRNMRDFVRGFIRGYSGADEADRLHRQKSP